MVADVTMSLRSRRRERTIECELAFVRQRETKRLTLPQQSHEDISVQRPLVSFIENDDAVAIEISFIERFSKQNSVRHV